MGHLVQKLVVEDASKTSSLVEQHVALVAPDGTPFSSAHAGAATSSKAGLVRKAAAVSPVQAADAADAAGGAPTKAEFDKAAALANETKRQLNDLIEKLKAAGIAE